MMKSIQQDAIDCITKLVLDTQHVNYIFLKGSIARGEQDQYSDVDYYCVVDKEYYSEFLEKRIQILEGYKKLVYYSESNFVGPQIVGVFDNGLHFDFYTLVDVPKYGTDAIKVIYDKDGQLSEYIKIKNEPDEKQIATYFNEFTFSLLEFEAAYCRGDLIWSVRLGSHLLGDLSLILSYIYDPDKPFVGMMRLGQKLPIDIYEKVIEANNLLTPKDILKGILCLIELAEIIYEKLEDNYKNKINISFFRFMKDRLIKL